MDRENLNWWLALLANLGVLAGLIFVGLEIRQNTKQLRADASHSITAMVNELNADAYGDPTLLDLLLRGEQDLSLLSELERARFDRFHFSRLNVAEHILQLEREGVSDLNFRYADFVVREFQDKPGLQAFVREYEGTYVGSEDFWAKLRGR